MSSVLEIFCNSCDDIWAGTTFSNLKKAHSLMTSLGDDYLDFCLKKLSDDRKNELVTQASTKHIIVSCESMPELIMPWLCGLHLFTTPWKGLLPSCLSSPLRTDFRRIRPECPGGNIYPSLQIP